MPSLLAHIPRHLQLQSVQHPGRRSLCRLTDQQMYMLRHYHVPDQPKSHLVADFSQLLYEEVARTYRLQQWQPPITTEGNKMQMTLAVVALQPSRHRRPRSGKCQPKTRVPKPNLGHPPRPPPSAGIAELIYSPRLACQHQTTRITRATRPTDPVERTWTVPQQ